MAVMSGSVVAQTDQSTSAVKDVLAKQEGDVSSTTTVLEETLTATDKRYSLLRSGRFALTYDFNYSYIGEQLIEADFTEQDLTNFRIQNTQGHTLTNTVSLDYGVLDNLTANVSVPLVSKYSDTDEIDGDAHSIGDVAVGARFQPFPVQHNWPSLTISATGTFPTGRSPYESSQTELATGSGHGSAVIGLNTSKVIDPVAIFGTLNYIYNFSEDNLDYIQNDNLVTEVSAGSGIGWGAGFAYAMSYDITTTMSFQQYLLEGTKLSYIDGEGNPQKQKTANQTSAVLNLGLGVRVANATTLNFTVGIGLTPDSPDFTVGLNAPLRF